jgi:hypothetical protein
VISISDTDYEWLKKQSKELGRELFKDALGSKKKKGADKEEDFPLPIDEHEEVE